MGLKNIFILMMEGKPYTLFGLDTSKKSIGDLIEYVTETYSDDVEYFNILQLDDSLLDDFIAGDDLTLKVTAVLSKINNSIPHLLLSSYV